VNTSGYLDLGSDIDLGSVDIYFPIIPSELSERLVELLGKLAENESIADYLAACGVKGVCTGAEDCPVAVWLRDHLNGETVMVTASKCWIPGEGYVDTPVKVADFIAAFDTGAYPHLEEQ
jgi:hypothetical protein